MANHAGGIAMIAFIVALAVSMSYYQFFYIPQANAKPVLPEEVTNPDEEFLIKISQGSSLESNPEFYVPDDARATIGINNRVVWQNDDTVPHTVTTDNDYRDAYSGVFDSRERPEDEGGAFVMPGETYEFLFTKVGEYPYHCEPHPWMQASVEIIENFA
jgi:plastocyanin